MIDWKKIDEAVNGAIERHEPCCMKITISRTATSFSL